MAVYYFSWVEGRLVHIDDKHVESCRAAGVDVIELVPKDAADDLAEVLSTRVGVIDSAAWHVARGLALSRYNEEAAIVDDLPDPNRHQ